MSTSTHDPSVPSLNGATWRDRCVIAEGLRAGAKGGPALQMGHTRQDVVMTPPTGDDAWWRVPGGAQVRVRGWLRAHETRPEPHPDWQLRACPADQTP